MSDIIPITPQERFVNDIYASADVETTRGIEQLRSEEGIVPTCTLGCNHCCRFHILMNIAEAHTLAQYVLRIFSTAQIDNLAQRTYRWHAWDNSRPGRPASGNVFAPDDFIGYDHTCPLLENSVCSAYPVRPMVCRSHYVRSDPFFCFAANNPESKEERPEVLSSVVKATSPYSIRIRESIEKAGLDFSQSIMLLPHWLAIKMNWDFALSS